MAEAYGWPRRASVVYQNEIVNARRKHRAGAVRGRRQHGAQQAERETAGLCLIFSTSRFLSRLRRMEMDEAQSWSPRDEDSELKGVRCV